MSQEGVQQKLHGEQESEALNDGQEKTRQKEEGREKSMRY